MSSLYLSLRPAIETGVGSIARLLEGAVARNARLLTEAAVALSNYREEGLELFPAVYFCNGLSQLLRASQGQDARVFGDGPATEDTVRLALKRCAPLSAGRQWAVFLWLEGDLIRYGVFRSQMAPLSPTSFEHLRSLCHDGAAVVGLTRVGASIVEVRASDGQCHYIDFSGATAGDRSPPEVLRTFIGAATRDADPELKEQFEAFYYRVGIDLLHSTHGALVAVVPRDTPLPLILSDGMLLEEPVRLDRSMAAYQHDCDESTALALISYRTLLRGMLGVDGITVLSSDGAILGYNCFIHDAAIGARARGMLGGARRRAYEILCSRLGQGLSAVLYKSQDGPVECRLG